jgi:hypothetical protein
MAVVQQGTGIAIQAQADASATTRGAILEPEVAGRETGGRVHPGRRILERLVRVRRWRSGQSDSRCESEPFRDRGAKRPGESNRASLR